MNCEFETLVANYLYATPLRTCSTIAMALSLAQRRRKKGTNVATITKIISAMVNQKLTCAATDDAVAFNTVCR